MSLQRFNMRGLTDAMTTAIQDWLSDPIDENCVTLCEPQRYCRSKHRTGKLHVKSRPVAMYRGLM